MVIVLAKKIVSEFGESLNGELLLPDDKGYAFAKAVTPDSVLGKTFFLFDGSPFTVSAYDQMTFRLLGSLSIQGNTGTPGSLIRGGTNGLAFRTTGDQLFLIKSSLVQ